MTPIMQQNIRGPEYPRPSAYVFHRTAFLLECLQDLDEQLRAKGSRLFVVRGKPEEVLPGLFKEWKVKKLTFEADSEPRSRERDREVGWHSMVFYSCDTLLNVFHVRLANWLYICV